MRERRCVAREVVGMAPRATCLAGLREVVLAACSVGDGRRSCVVRGRGAKECRRWGLRSSGCVRGVQRASQLVRVAALARAARVVGRGLRGAQTCCGDVVGMGPRPRKSSAARRSCSECWGCSRGSSRRAQSGQGGMVPREVAGRRRCCTDGSASSGRVRDATFLWCVLVLLARLVSPSALVLA